MKMRYFIVNGQGQLARTRRCLIEDLWRGYIRAGDMGGTDPQELRLVSVLCDDDLIPARVYLLRLPLSDGSFTRRDYRTLRSHSCPDIVTPSEMVHHHTHGWPRNFFWQLAVALDVPRRDLEVPVGIGGPLMMAAAMRVSPGKAMRFLR